MVEFLSGGRIQGSSTLTSSPPQTSWKELGRTTLSSAGDTITVDNLTSKDNILILSNLIPSGAVSGQLRFNNDSSSNYAYRISDNGGSDGSGGNDTQLYSYIGTTATQKFSVFSVINNATSEKLVMGDVIDANTSGAGNAPNRRESFGKWANTSDSITRVDVLNHASGNFASGSEVVVLGCDNDEVDSGTNFWQQLDDTTITSTTSTVSSGTFTAKKYLYFELRKEKTGGYVNPKLYFNSDTSGNYSVRYNDNAGSDSTATSQSNIYMRAGELDGRSLTCGYIINISNTPKYVIAHSTNAGSEGAGTSVSLNDVVGKWSNTSDQITKLNFTETAGGSFASGTRLTVWGAN